jgi:hypothetical protein
LRFDFGVAGTLFFGDLRLRGVRGVVMTVSVRGVPLARRALLWGWGYVRLYGVAGRVRLRGVPITEPEFACAAACCAWAARCCACNWASRFEADWLTEYAVGVVVRRPPPQLHPMGNASSCLQMRLVGT